MKKRKVSLLEILLKLIKIYVKKQIAIARFTFKESETKDMKKTNKYFTP